MIRSLFTESQRRMPLAALAGIVLSFSPLVLRGATVDTSNPTALIETSANAMLSELEANRADFRKNPAKLSALVERVLLPNFDVEHAARLVLGKHWRSATADQRRRFIDAFYGSLMANYGDALVEFTGDRIRVLPTPLAAEATTAGVR
ncbi:MAG: MlaC/ttg2D family ABC transporter substrate-binding protein, partial [Steroidobacteraceae bacterium]